MRALVVVASRHGATREIGDVLARGLREHGVEARGVDAAGGEAPDGHDAVILGSAVYMGRWLEPARDYAARHADALRARRVWLFSSGPLGDPPLPAADHAVDLGDLPERVAAEGHMLFGGRVDRGLLGFRERAVMTAVRAQEGDFRDWDAVGAWAAEIAAALTGPP
jgi:menaquinone-dependent protoporphyrinogen oxidase